MSTTAAQAPSDTTSRPVRIGLVIVSDRASRGEYADRGGPALETYLTGVLTCAYETFYRLIPDDREQVEATLIELADTVGCDLILTSGGTGPAPRDITVDATAAVCPQHLPGFGEVMRYVSLQEVPTAILSRQMAGTRGSCLMINLPGKPQAIQTCLDAVFAAIPDCVDLIGGARITTDPERVIAYRPH